MAQVRVVGDHEASTLKQMDQVAAHPAVIHAALLADGHLGYGFPIGGVAAYKEHISLSGVGFDIGCGNKAVRLDMTGSEARPDIRVLMDLIWENISFGMGRKNDTRVDHELFDSPAWSITAAAPLKELARNQLGTVGGGNHFCNVMVDEKDRVWISVHFGSRGLGHKITKWFLDQVNAGDDMHAAPVVFEENSNLGAEYIEGMRLGLRYAYAGRDWVCSEVARLFGAKIVEEVHNNHNFADKETHGGDELWVVRKGSTPAFPGQKGFIGATMAEPSVIVEGVDSPLSEELVRSTVHGAGRMISRSRAAGLRNRRTGELLKDANGNVKRPPEVTKQMMNLWVREAGVELRGADVDESPHCYKRLDEVLKFHAETIRILHTLTPIGVAMAGSETFDPYKD